VLYNDSINGGKVNEKCAPGQKWKSGSGANEKAARGLDPEPPGGWLAAGGGWPAEVGGWLAGGCRRLAD